MNVQTVKSWFYDRNDRKEKTVPISKFGFVRPMTARCLWRADNKQSIADSARQSVPVGPGDTKWIGEFSHQFKLHWDEACENEEVAEEYRERAEKFKEGQTSPEMKAR